MKAERKSRPPGREYPKQDSVGADIHNGLYGNSPVSPAMVGTTDTCNTRNEDGGYLYLTTLFHHEITEKIGRRGSTETSDEETQKLETGQPGKLGCMVEIGDERSAKKKYEVK